ncbi:globin [Vibrio sp. 1249-1]|uniref:globin n=1 Tax=Vibrio sp. 1249-1 TaxID=3074547 RepID=UPI002964C577|nr:globin [Vibrio sp. 1249-1]MDW2453862.1 globin [Vibrio sp. 1249-1]
MNVIEVFNDSYERCASDQEFFDLFYKNLWSKSANFRQKFDGIDMHQQVRMLRGSIVFFMMADTSTEAHKMVEKYGKKHASAEIGIEPQDFDVWLESSLETVRQCDSGYDTDVETAWRTCFKTGLEVMKQECDKEDGHILKASSK